MIENKKIVVFGANGLIGNAIVKRCLEAKAEVIAVDISTAFIDRNEQLSDFINAQSLSYFCLDLNKEDELAEFLNQNPDIDGVVNSVYPRNTAYGSHLLDVTLANFNENVALNTGSTFNLLKQLAVRFKESGQKVSIVNINSIYGVMLPDFSVYEGTPMTMPVEYTVIKHSQLALCGYFAKYVKNSKFRVNSVSPGGIEDGQPEGFLAAYKAKSNGTGMLQPDDICGAVEFLLSDDSQFVNGQNIVVDDGFTL